MHAIELRNVMWEIDRSTLVASIFIRSSQIHSKYVHTCPDYYRDNFSFLFLYCQQTFSIETTKLILQIHIFSKQSLKNKISRKLLSHFLLLKKTNFSWNAIIQTHVFFQLWNSTLFVGWYNWWASVICEKWQQSAAGVCY